jgi:hypothetical protein
LKSKYTTLLAFVACASKHTIMQIYSSAQLLYFSARVKQDIFDTNVPGLPWRAPSANPSNLKLTQLQQYRESLLQVVEA